MDQRPCLVLDWVNVMTLSARHCEAFMMCIKCISRHNSYQIWCSMGSQCNCFNAGDTWSNSPKLMASSAAVLRTHWRGPVADCRRPARMEPSLSLTLKGLLGNAFNAHILYCCRDVSWTNWQKWLVRRTEANHSSDGQHVDCRNISLCVEYWSLDLKFHAVPSCTMTAWV